MKDALTILIALIFVLAAAEAPVARGSNDNTDPDRKFFLLGRVLDATPAIAPLATVDLSSDTTRQGVVAAGTDEETDRKLGMHDVGE